MLLVVVLWVLVGVGGGGGVGLVLGVLLSGPGGLVGVVEREDLLDDVGDGLVARGAIGQVEQVEDPHPAGSGKV